MGPEHPRERLESVQELAQTFANGIAGLRTMLDILAEAERRGRNLSGEDVTKAWLLGLSLVNEIHPQLDILRTTIVETIRTEIERQESQRPSRSAGVDGETGSRP